MTSTYAILCALLCGFANFLMWTGYFSSSFISEPVLHSVNQREPDRIGAHDGYYGMAVSNAFYMLSTLAMPSLTNYFKCKWILALSGSFFTLYFLAFQYLSRYLYLFACAVLGVAFAASNFGHAGYLTEFSTRQTIEMNQALSWAVTCFCVLGAGAVNFAITASNLNANGTVSKYPLLGTLAMCLFSLLPNREVKDNIAASNVRCKTLKEQLAVMISVLFHRRVLILVPFYLYLGIFFSFWSSIIPTTLQFTKGMSLITIKMSTIVHNFSFKPLMIINAILHLSIYALIVCVIPKWSAVRPNDEPSLLIQPSALPILILAFLCGIADAANNTSRTVISSLLFPTRRLQTLGASRFYHGLAASVLFFASPSLSIYGFATIMVAFLVVTTIVYLHTCNFVTKEEKKVTDRVAPVDFKNSHCVN